VSAHRGNGEVNEEENMPSATIAELATQLEILRAERR
jgi:hypothetical protein